LRLATLTGREDLRDKAERTLHLFRGLMEQSPMAAGQMLIALDYYLGPGEEFAVVGDPASEETRRVLRALGRGFRPDVVTALKPAAGDTAALEQIVPLLVGKEARGEVTTYVCRNFACAEPLIGADALEAVYGR